MILCQSASHGTNIYYSALKFLRFEGFVWSGDFLPLKIQPLSELFSVQVTLRDQTGGKIAGAYWERGLLHAPFMQGATYNLDMRLEYCLPVAVTTFETDFASIHPRNYITSLDFSRSQLAHQTGQVRLDLGETTTLFPTTEPFEQTLPQGHLVTMAQRDEYISFTVRHQSTVPFGHVHFPRLSLV